MMDLPRGGDKDVRIDRGLEPWSARAPGMDLSERYCKLEIIGARKRGCSAYPRGPLSVVVTGGLATSTLLALIVMPTLYAVPWSP
jgi:hypothetical protein